MRRAALAAAALILVAAPQAATAFDVSRADLAALAERAQADPAAIAELEGVTSVSGVAADPAAALAGAAGPELEARLVQMARAARAEAPAGLSASEARARAAEVLANDELRPPDPQEEEEEGLGLPGVPLWLALALALAVAIVAGATARTLARNTVIERELGGAVLAESRDRPRDLDGAADHAERQGDFAAAVRLRFQAGLARLDDAGAIRLRPSLTAAGAARESGSSRLGGLADAYQRIVFGGRPAAASDAEKQRSGWSAVLDEIRRR